MAESKFKVSELVAAAGSTNAATALLIQLGLTEEQAAQEITDAAEAIAEATAAAALNGFRDGMKSMLLEFAPDDLIPDNVDRFEVALCWTREERKEANDQIIPAGYYVRAFKAKTDEMEKAVSLMKGSRHKPRGASNGGVPVPSGAPFTGWKSYVTDHTSYDHDPDNAPENGEDRSNYCPVSMGGKSISAPGSLRKVKDELFLECARIHKEEARQATWEEVKEYA